MESMGRVQSQRVAETPLVALVASESNGLSKVKRILASGDYSRLVEARDVDDLRAKTRFRAPDVAVLETRAASSRELVVSIQTLRASYPACTVLALMRLAPEEVRQLVSLARAGVADVLFEGVDSDEEMVRRIQYAGQNPTSLEQWIRESVEAVTAVRAERTRAVVMYCFQAEGDRTDVAQVAAFFHVTRRTLQNWMAREGLPGPSALLAWGRLLQAAFFLTLRGHTVESVALRLGYGSTASFRRCLWRHARLRVRELRSCETPAMLLDRLTNHARAIAAAQRKGVA